MNHNGVISLPSDGSSTYTAGMIVSLNSSGQAAANGGTGDGIGVVLHDVKADETGRPLDIQLFSAGGSALVKANGSITVGQEVGYADNDSDVDSSGANKIGYALEVGATGGLVRVILK